MIVSHVDPKFDDLLKAAIPDLLNKILCPSRERINVGDDVLTVPPAVCADQEVPVSADV